MIWNVRPIAMVLSAAALGALNAPAALAAPASHGPSREQIRTCESTGDIAADLRISTCSAVIDASKNKHQKAVAFANRGKAYRAKGSAADELIAMSLGNTGVGVNIGLHVTKPYLDISVNRP